MSAKKEGRKEKEAGVKPLNGTCMTYVFRG